MGLLDRPNGELDDATRAETVKQMQKMLYADAPYLVTAYNTLGEAFRSDRFACLQPQPDPGGIWLLQYGAKNYLDVRPAEQAGDCDGVASAVGASDTANIAATADDATDSNMVLVGAAVVLVLLFAGGGLLMARRRASAADRE